MEICELSVEEYAALTPRDVPIYCKTPFLELNAAKVSRVHYLLGKDTKKRILLAIGEKSGEWLAPYSAPFSSISFLKKEISVEHIWDFVQSLTFFAQSNGAKKMSLYLPPDIYCAEFSAKISNALFGIGWQVAYQDINYSLDLQAIDLPSYNALIQHNARKNLRISLGSGLRIVRCESEYEKELAYNVIAENRSNKGYPLRMTKQQLMETIQIVEHDFFLVYHDDLAIASAVVYHVTQDIAQVIYWGDIANVGEYKPINFLSFQLIEFYKQHGFRILDIGPSTEEGKPNYGLCSFKESIGCIATTKYRFEIDLQKNGGGGHSLN